ncbi:MAG TPA: GAF domain-containing protein [Anaerolineales bacterium]|nr:GAF domain-containing protein [Anaerolineales bacterium]
MNLQTLAFIVIVLVFLVLIGLVARNFRNFSLRVKILLGILLTGSLALGILAFFAITRAAVISDSLSNRLDTSVRLLAEEQLVNTAFLEADRANQFFEGIERQVTSLASYRVSLESQKLTFNQGTYWDATAELTRLEGGQYGNSAADPSSVFVPANTRLSDEILAELNTSAYLDFSAPSSLEGNPSMLAIYYISATGAVRYYPNIGLASLLPPDFDATSRPYYRITAPLFNPQRLSRWTIPYVDAAGGGLVVTVASPVYIGDTFNGVVAADIQLSRITEQVSSLKIGQTGYAFMIDDAGRIISMPPAGYAMFGINPEALAPEEYFKQTVMGAGPDELSSITNRMTAGGNGLNIIKVNGADTYISYAPIKANGYNLALVVPVSEMQTAIVAARNETRSQIQTSLWQAAVILVGLLAVAIVISLAISQVISAPVVRLTETTNQIVEGDLTAQALVTSHDETGRLAEAFNTMTSRLREALMGLEQRVAERTAELALANERNERRAKQFESIAKVSGTISSTRNLDNLLPQITSIISDEFGFYHVGIFLLDTAREYAILSAANSEGGQRMLERSHRLKVGETGLVGYVTSTGKPRVALDTGADVIFFDNPDLPETRSEITLPLRVGEEIIGALDVQSKQPNAFNQEDIQILSTLADQVSIAIENARQHEETRRALVESESLSRQFIQSGWSRFARSQSIEGIRHTGAKSTLLYRKSGNENGKGQSGTGQLWPRGRGAVLALPVKLRGEVIGTVDIRSPENQKWDQDELDIVNAILERAAIAMENARLLTESQKLAAKERTIGEISAKISAQSEIEELLKTAAQELGRSLPGMEISIQLAKEATE